MIFLNLWTLINFNFSLQANIIFGKTIENVRDYSQVKLHTTKESALRAISKHTYKSHVILSKNLVQTNHFNEVILLNKPIAIGVSILELVNYFFINLFFKIDFIDQFRTLITLIF